MANYIAKYVTKVTVKDPDSGFDVEVSIYKDQFSDGLFGIDSSYLDQVCNDKIVIDSPFNIGKIELIG